MRFVPVLIFMALLGACAHRAPPLVSTADLIVTQDTELPLPTRADSVAVKGPSLLGPQDAIAVEVFGIPELSREDIQIDPGGQIQLPLVGTIEAAGKTAPELAAIIEGALRRQYVREPHVTVTLRNGVSQAITVDGQVVEPGLYPVTSEMTLMRVVASAKGLSEYAKLNDVVILRTVNGQRMAGLYNLDAIRRGTYSDPRVFARDVVIVGDSPTRRTFRDIVSLSTILSAPLIALLQ